MADFGDDLNEIKKLIHHNIQLFRLHDYIKAQAGQAEVLAVCRASMFSANTLPWYTSISSLYSSIALVSEFMNKKNDDPNSLDQNFTFANWSIHACNEHDDQGNPNTVPPDLKVVIRRLRNSVRHGRFELVIPTDNNIRNYKISFKDIDNQKPATHLRKNFLLEIKAIEFLNFLQRFESSFNSKYP